MAHQTQEDQPQQATEHDRRRHGRVRPVAVYSDAGRVLDMSAGGMRVMSRRRLKGETEFIICNESKIPINVRARVVWTKRVGFRKHVVGLEFVDLQPAVARQLASMGTRRYGA